MTLREGVQLYSLLGGSMSLQLSKCSVLLSYYFVYLSSYNLQTHDETIQCYRETSHTDASFIQSDVFLCLLFADHETLDDQIN